MKEDESLYPMDIALLGAQTIVLASNGVPLRILTIMISPCHHSNTSRLGKGRVRALWRHSLFERLRCSGPAQHLVHLIEMQLFRDDHFSGIFLKQDGIPLSNFQQVVIGGERCFLNL